MQVFISYDQKDTLLAHRLANDLKQYSVRVWIAPESIRPGETWVEAINHGLQESSHVAVILTPAALESEWVKMETNVAISLERKGKLKLLPLYVEACELPPLWAAYQVISFHNGYENGLSQLVENFSILDSERDSIPATKNLRSAIFTKFPRISKKVVAIIAEQIDADVANILPMKRLIEDLHMDALDLVEMTMALEEEFGIEAPPDESYDRKTETLKLRTVADWVDFIASRLGASAC